MNLPVEEVHCYLNDEECSCEACGNQLHVFGQKIVREEVQFIPASLKKKIYIEHSYECHSCRNTDKHSIKRASAPKAPLQRSFAGPTVLAWLFHQKYELSLPLYRQEKEWAQYGLQLNRNTLSNWVIRSSEDWLEPIYDRLRYFLNQEEVIHADETPYQILKRPDGRPATADARIWLFQSSQNGIKPIVYYHASLTRSRSNIEEVLDSYRGYIHCDGYSAYQNMANLQVVACWAHVRRKFFEAGDERGMAAIGKEYCDRLFLLERQFKHLSPKERKIQRQRYSLPLLSEFWEWLSSFPVIAKSKLGTAIAYTQRLKKELMAFLDDGRLVLSNNLAERNIRPLTVGRKNFMFSTSVAGAKANCVAYTLIETAKINGLNPFKYLTCLFEKLPNLDFYRKPELLEDYLPWSDQMQFACKE